MFGLYDVLDRKQSSLRINGQLLFHSLIAALHAWCMFFATKLVVDIRRESTSALRPNVLNPFLWMRGKKGGEMLSEGLAPWSLSCLCMFTGAISGRSVWQGNFVSFCLTSLFDTCCEVWVLKRYCCGFEQLALGFCYARLPPGSGSILASTFKFSLAARYIGFLRLQSSSRLGRTVYYCARYHLGTTSLRLGP